MNLDINEFSNDNSLSQEKKEFMTRFIKEAESLHDQKEGMTFFKNKLKEARDAGITFSNADILLLAGYLQQNASPKEQMMIQKILTQYNIKHS